MTLPDRIARLTDDECWRIFISLRWPQGIRCIKCNTVQHKLYRERRPHLLRYYCQKCRIWFNDFTGTVFHGTHLALKQWFQAIHFFLQAGETSIDVAHRLNINRHTAQSLRRAISKHEQWCRLLLNRISGDLNKNVVYLMALNEVQKYLGVSRRTLYRLVSTGALSATKVGGQWRFKPEDVQKYITHKLNRYGTTAIPETILFRPEVLDKYRKDKTKYYIQEEAYQGWVGSKEDYNFMQNALSVLGKGAKDAGALGQIAFYDLHYRKVVAPGGTPALAISQKDYAALPSEEYVHWSHFRIT